MSQEAMAWVLNEAPGLPSHAFGVLMGLAHHANAHGIGAFPAQATLAAYARKSVRQVRRDLNDLESAGLIRAGSSEFVAHFPPDERPGVWDLAMSWTNESAPESEGTGRPRPAADVRSLIGQATQTSADGPDVDDRADVDVRSDTSVLSKMAIEDKDADLDRTPTTGRTYTTGRVRPTNKDSLTEVVLTPSVSGSRRSTNAPAKSRIPEDFTVTDAMIAWFNKNTPNLDGPGQTEAFMDHWRADASPKALKVDWVAAWRTWMRNAVKWSSAPSVPGPRQPGNDKPTTGQQRLADAARIAEDMRRLDEADGSHQPPLLFALPQRRIA